MSAAMLTSTLVAYDPEAWSWVNASPDPTIVIQDGRHVFANAKALELYGARDVAELAARPATEHMTPESRPEAEARLATMAVERKQLGYVHEAITRLDGGVCHIEAAGTPILFGGRPAALVVMRDVTDRVLTEQARVRAEAARVVAEQRFQAAFVHAPIGFGLIGPTGVVSDANDALLDALRAPRERVIGSSVWEWVDRQEHMASHVRFDSLVTGAVPTIRAEIRLSRADGTTGWCHAHTSRLPSSGDADVPAFVIQIEDITARREAEEQLRRQAATDPLTGLANRATFIGALHTALGDTRSDGVAVLFIDLDRFKVVNDSLGHCAGDELLLAVTQRLRLALRSDDVVARLGGDEFAVLLDSCTGEQAAITAARLLSALSAPVQLAGTPVYVGASIGIASAGRGSDPSVVLRDADLAMYRAKATGGSCFVAFDEQMRNAAVSYMDLQTGLFQALPRGELQVHYQPIVAPGTGHVTGFEALLRWQRDDGRVVAPADFIPIAEDTGLIVPIGGWVLRQAVGQLRRWRDADPGMPAATMAVNVSLRQVLDVGFEATVRRLYRSLGPDRLVLEITETAAVNITPQAVGVLDRLRAAGVLIAIDDFGTGHSSLGRLHALPVDVLKIDRQFIGAVACQGSGSDLVRAIVAMADALGITTVAEGVETDEQSSAVAALGCTFAQGFFYGRPQPATAARALLRG